MSSQARPKGTVLVVDDDDAVRSGLYWALASDYHVLQAGSREAACALMNNEEIQVVSQTTSTRKVDFAKTISGPEIIEFQRLVRQRRPNEKSIHSRPEPVRFVFRHGRGENRDCDEKPSCLLQESLPPRPGDRAP